MRVHVVAGNFNFLFDLPTGVCHLETKNKLVHDCAYSLDDGFFLEFRANF